MRSTVEFQDDLNKISIELFGHELYDSNRIRWRDLETLAIELRSRDPELLNWFINDATPRHGHGYSVRYFLTKKPIGEMDIPINLIIGKNIYDNVFKCSCCGKDIDGHQEKIDKKEGIFLRINLIGNLAKEFPNNDVQVHICKECLDDNCMFEGEVDIGDHKYSPLGLR